jgi:hypothetical protein
VLEPGPTSLDLAGSRLAFGWDSADELGPTSSAYLDTIGARTTRRRLLTVASGDIQGLEVIEPGVSGGYAWSALTWFGDRTANELRRFGLEGGAAGTVTFASGATFGSVLGAAVDGSRLFYLRAGIETQPGCSPASPCELLAEPLPAFTTPR